MKAEAAAKQGGRRSDVMGTDSIWKLLYNFSGPSIVGMLVASSYNLVDAIFVGMLGPEYQAAMTVTMPLLMLFMAFAMGIGVGGGSFIGRSLGAKKYDEANKICGVTISLMLIVSAILTALLIPSLGWILPLFGASGRVTELAATYGGICIWFTFMNCMNMVLANIVRAEGNPVLSSTVQIISAVCNIITDPLFILGWLGFPRMEMAGAAWTTVFSWAVGVGIYAYYFIAHKTQFSLKWSDFIPDYKIIKEIFRVGLASIVRLLAGSFVQIFGNAQAAAFGVIPLAVKGVLMRAGSFFFMPTMGIGQGVLPLLAYNYGAHKRARMGEILFKSCLLGVFWGGFCFIGAMFFPRFLMGFFGSSAEFLDTGSMALRIFSISFFTIGVQMIMSFYFQAVGEGMSSLLLASSRQIIFLLPLMYILPHYFGVNGLWLTFPAADLLAFSVTATWTLISFKKYKIPFKMHPAPDVEEGPENVPVTGKKPATEIDLSEP
jgi:putative MATE family efflux protein